MFFDYVTTLCVTNVDKVSVPPERNIFSTFHIFFCHRLIFEAILLFINKQQQHFIWHYCECSYFGINCDTGILFIASYHGCFCVAVSLIKKWQQTLSNSSLRCYPLYFIYLILIHTRHEYLFYTLINQNNILVLSICKILHTIMSLYKRRQKIII